MAAAALALPAALAATAAAQTQPVFVNGQAQVVPAFNISAQWVRQRLWVETEFDSDGDGKRDRMHVDVTRPAQTDSENLKVPVIYETSPYYAGTASTASQYFWNTNQEVGAAPPPRLSPPAIAFNPNRTSISTSEVSTWVPRGFAVVHSESPGSGLSQGCPTVGGTNENDGPKAVVDWLNGRAKGYTTIDGTTEVNAYWSTGKVGMTGTSYNGTLPISAATTGVAGPRGDHPDRAEHVLLPLLPLERAGPEPRRLARRGHRLPLRLHQQRRPGAAAVLHRHGPRGPDEGSATTGSPATTTTSGPAATSSTSSRTSRPRR